MKWALTTERPRRQKSTERSDMFGFEQGLLRSEDLELHFPPFIRFAGY
jgi:hypothetical protein